MEDLIYVFLLFYTKAVEGNPYAIGSFVVPVVVLLALGVLAYLERNDEG